MVSHSKLLKPKELSVGALVQARDPKGFWYNAKVIEKTGRGASMAVIVHYIGFAKRWDEKFTAKDEGLRERISAAELRDERDDKLYDGCAVGRLDDGKWQIERLVRKVAHNSYQVRWMGWGPDHDTIEKHLPRAYIVEFEDEHEALAELRKNPPKKPKIPFSTALVAHESPELLEARILDCAEVVSDVAIECASRAARQKTAAAEVLFWKSKPITAGMFHAMREMLVRMVPTGGDVDTVVSPVAKLRGGTRPVDVFSLYDADILANLMGNNHVVYHAATNRAIMMAVPPFDVFLVGKLDAQGALQPVKEMRVKSHWAGVVPDHSNPGTVIFRTDDTAYQVCRAAAAPSPPPPHQPLLPTRRRSTPTATSPRTRSRSPSRSWPWRPPRRTCIAHGRRKCSRRSSESASMSHAACRS